MEEKAISKSKLALFWGKVKALVNSAVQNLYTKPSGGIPKNDLSDEVKTSLGKADTALQSFTESDPTVPAWAKQPNKPTYTAQEVGALPSSTPIPSKTSDLTNDSGFLTQHQDISGKQDVIDDLQTIRSGAAKGETALQSFTETDPTVPSWAKQPSKPSYTASEVGALPDTTPIPTPDVFFAEYGVTTKDEVISQYNNGRLVVCIKDGVEYHIACIASDNSFVYFGSIVTTTSRYILLTNSWILGQRTLEGTSDKVSDIFSNRESTTKYPNTKAVFDAIGKYGVVSQTQTWTGSDATGYDYTMSNLVYGEIPQANIDLFVEAGAVFNETTGYFELNGLTDISYEEMVRIYNKPITSIYQASRYLNAKTMRTTLPIMGGACYANGGSGFQLGNTFNSSNLEVIRINKNSNYILSSGLAPASMGSTFRIAKRLKIILSPIRIDNPYMAEDFTGCCSLETIYIGTNGTKSLNFPDSPRLTLDSVVYMVDNSSPTSAITITLHATAFARCQVDTTEYTYNGNTYTGIIAYAAAKSITIQSA